MERAVLKEILGLAPAHLVSTRSQIRVQDQDSILEEVAHFGCISSEGTGMSRFVGAELILGDFRIPLIMSFVT